MKEKIINRTEYEETILLTEKREDKIQVRRGETYASENERLKVIDIREAGIMVMDLETNRIRKEKCADFIRLIEAKKLEKAVVEPAQHAELSKVELEVIKTRADVFECFLEDTYPHWEGFFSRRMLKVNYEKFQGVEVAQEGKKAQKIDLLAKIK